MTRLNLPGGRRAVFAAAALAGLAAAATAYLLFFTPTQRAARRHLAEADAKSAAAVGTRLRPLAEFFAKGRKGAKPFAAEALGWGGKWELVKSMAGGGGHKEFLAAAFARHVFGPEELRAAIEGVCFSYADDLTGVENEMLVRLRADVADLDRYEFPVPDHLKSNEAFARAYQKLAATAAGRAQADLAVTAARELTTLVATEVATRVAMQAARAAAELGIKSAVLGSGGASMIATLGVGLVVAVIIDHVLDAVLQLVGYDPEAKVAAAVVGSIDRLEEALTLDPNLIERSLGLGRKGALRAEMEKLHAERSRVRRDAVTQVLKGGDVK